MRYRGYSSPGFSMVGYIIITCVALWIAVSVNRDLISLFGFQPQDLLDMKQPWTMVTSMFVHARFPNFSHVLFNMLVLYFFGGVLISLVGEKRFLALYLLGGLAGNIVFMLLNLGYPLATVIGASGAIFAVEGALMVMRPRLPVIIFPIPVPVPLWVSVIGAFVLTSFVASIAWEAHLGGFVVGLVAGYYFRRREMRSGWRR